MLTLIKISGHELDNSAFLQAFAQTIQAWQTPCVIVHGGGKEISALQQKFGIEPRYHQGVRITDAESLDVVRMVLCGAVNLRLTRVLLEAGVRALGVNGVTGRLISARPMQVDGVDMGYTGEPVAVQADLLKGWLAQGLTPVIAPICYGETSDLNVNADHVAGAVAGALNADKLIFLSNVEGVLKDGMVLPALSTAQTQALIADGTISGGMIPKVQTALDALQQGVAQTVITNLRGLQTHGGTVFSQA